MVLARHGPSLLAVRALLAGPHRCLLSDRQPVASRDPRLGYSGGYTAVTEFLCEVRPRQSAASRCHRGYARTAQRRCSSYANMLHLLDSLRDFRPDVSVCRNLIGIEGHARPTQPDRGVPGCWGPVEIAGKAPRQDQRILLVATQLAGVRQYELSATVSIIPFSRASTI
jgi:hypothetical protein